MANSRQDRAIAAPGTAEALLEPPVGLCVAAPWWGFEAVMAEAYVAARAQPDRPSGSWRGFFEEIRRRASSPSRWDEPRDPA